MFGTPAHLGTGGKLFYTGSDFRKNQNVIPYAVWDICAPALRISSPAYQLNRVSAVLGIISAIWRISSDCSSMYVLDFPHTRCVSGLSRISFLY